MNSRLNLLLAVWFGLGLLFRTSAQSSRTPQESLNAYHASLDSLRREWPNVRPMPDLKFFLFGMGDRRKMIYHRGELKDARTGAVIRKWKVAQEYILPADYSVMLQDERGVWTLIRENQTGVLLDDGKAKAYVTQSKLNLPSFRGKKYAPVLRVLHHEILMNVVDGKPVPNFFVYQKPWLRDATLMAMVLKTTRNLDQIKDWIQDLRDPFDRNNHGISEADNLGQILYLVSLVDNKSHPVVAMVLDSVKQFEKKNSAGERYLEGKTDYSVHPVFQTKWMKFGLQSLGLPDPYQIPNVYDSYSSLFWWAYKDEHVPGKKFDAQSGQNYPYLVWAEDHFYSRPGAPERRGTLSNRDYPLTWEARASDANYAELNRLDASLIKEKLSPSHTWHAAEMFLLLLDR